MPHQQGAVLMVYGLDPLRTNTDKLFNLMCLYGNVARVSMHSFIVLNNRYATVNANGIALHKRKYVFINLEYILRYLIRYVNTGKNVVT